MKKMISILFSFLLAATLIQGSFLKADAATGDNLALNKEVSASSSYNTTTFATGNAVDGDMSTRWGNKYNSTKFNRGKGDTEETYTVNLGAVYDVATVKINWEAAHPTTYTIQGSLDGETFFDIKDITEGKGGTESWYDFGVVETQYIRLAMHTCASQYGYSIWELEVYEPTDGTALEAVIEKAVAFDEESYSDTTYAALEEALMEGKSLGQDALQSEIDEAAAKIQTAINGLELRYPNLALGKTVTASSTYTGKDVNWLVDGTVKKTWQMNYATGSDYNRGNGDQTEEVTVDLGAAYAVDLINLTWKNGTFAKDVKVEGSLDNVNFFVMKEINDQEIAFDKQVQAIEDIGTKKVQYIRFSLSDPNNVTYGYEIYEIEVFEKNPTTTAFTNLALHKPVVDNPSEYNTTTYKKAHLTDGNISTRWGNAYSADAFKADPTETITIDLEDTYLLDRVILNFEASYATKIKLLGSTDGNEYFEMKEVTAASAGEVGITDLNSNVRYLRIYLSEPVGQYGFSIWEVKAYGSREAELEKEWTLLNEKLADVEPGLENGNMTSGAYYEYTNIADQAKVLIESETASYGAMRKSLLAMKDALANFDEFIIDSEVLVDIYPTVQNIKYTNAGGMKLESDVIDILVHGEQDVATLPKLKELLEAEGYSYNVTEEAGSNPAIILAVKCEASCEICTSVKDGANALDQAQGYVLKTDKENAQITIVGADVDGVYYGVMTLKQIFEQKNAEGMIPELVISDYPDTLFRGYVEGFYGFPWTTEERASLFEDTSKYKMTTYIYAPKDDPYHRDEWRDLYPAEESKDIQTLAAVATANNMDFCWTIHPGADYNYTKDNDGNGIVDDFEKITAKLDQVYGLGVRQFGIFYDDLSSSKMDGPAHAALINDSYEYLTSKYDDVKPFITVTSKYNNHWGGDWDTYFTPFMEQVHEDTIVLWTGNHTMSGINKEYMEVPQTETGVDRDLAVWWNYPVTDYCYGKLLMGSLDILDRDVDNINGFFLNPMSEADASKVAVFSGADYSWNIGAFESQKSWERSIAELAGTANGVNKSFERFADNISFGSLPERKSNFEFRTI